MDTAHRTSQSPPSGSASPSSHHHDTGPPMPPRSSKRDTCRTRVRRHGVHIRAHAPRGPARLRQAPRQLGKPRPPPPSVSKGNHGRRQQRPPPLTRIMAAPFSKAKLHRAAPCGLRRIPAQTAAVDVADAVFPYDYRGVRPALARVPADSPTPAPPSELLDRRPGVVLLITGLPDQGHRRDGWPPPAPPPWAAPCGRSVGTW